MAGYARACIGPGTAGGTVTAPPSKSVTHRLLFCAALANGVSHLGNISSSDDIAASLRAVRALGAQVSRSGDALAVQGNPGGLFLMAAQPTVDCGESASTLRFAIPLFALAPATSTFTGQGRLLQRPLTPYQALFKEQHLRFDLQEEQLIAEGPLSAGSYSLPGDVSSQFASGLLLALPLLAASSRIHLALPVESRGYIELTRQVQETFGVHSEWTDDTTLSVPGGQAYRAGNFAVEGDWSQAAFFAVLGAVRGGISLRGLSPRSCQPDAMLQDILQTCGCALGWDGDVLTITPPAAGLASPGNIDISACPDLGPALCVLALFCRGTTRFCGAKRLRLKESDRLAALQAELGKLGASITLAHDDLIVTGGHALHSGNVYSHNDHRIAMALAMTAAAAGVVLEIQNAACVQKSWPEFYTALQTLGIPARLI